MKPYKTQIGSTQKTWIEAANIVNIENILDCVILLNFFILCLLIPFQQDHLRMNVGPDEKNHPKSKLGLVGGSIKGRSGGAEMCYISFPSLSLILLDFQFNPI